MRPLLVTLVSLLWTFAPHAVGEGTAPARPGGRTGQPVRVELVLPYTVAPADRTVATARAVVGKKPLPDARLTLTIHDGAAQRRAHVALFDDGSPTHGDAEAGDGVHSAVLPDLAPGFYIAVARAELPGGGSASTSTSFEAFGPTGRLVGDVSDAGIDNEGDGFLDAIEFEASVEIVRAGFYALEMLVATSDGRKAWTRDGGAAMAAGPGTMTTRLSARDVADGLGADGPYLVRTVRLVWTPREVGDGPRTHVAHERSPEHTTGAYRIADLDRPYFAFAGLLDEERVDGDGDGRGETLRIVFGVDSAILGRHPFAWHADVVPIAGEASGKGTVHVQGEGTVGPGLNRLALDVPLARVGASAAVPGYVVRDLTIYPTRRLPAPYDSGTTRDLPDAPRRLRTHGAAPCVPASP